MICSRDGDQGPHTVHGRSCRGTLSISHDCFNDVMTDSLDRRRTRDVYTYLVGLSRYCLSPGRTPIRYGSICMHLLSSAPDALVTGLR